MFHASKWCSFRLPNTKCFLTAGRDAIPHFITILEITSTACVYSRGSEIEYVRRQTQQEYYYLKCALCGLTMFILGVIYFNSTHSTLTHQPPQTVSGFRFSRNPNRRLNYKIKEKTISPTVKSPLHLVVLFHFSPSFRSAYNCGHKASNKITASW